jgi:hypothetical protein
MQGGDDLMGKEVTVKGWCRTVRDQKAFSFIELNDGSLPKGIQVAEEKKRDTQKRPTNVSKRDLLIQSLPDRGRKLHCLLQRGAEADHRCRHRRQGYSSPESRQGPKV